MTENKLFWEVYNKASLKGEKFSESIYNSHHFGTKGVDTTDLIKLLSILQYLDLIRYSIFDYNNIDGLTEISNELNLL